MPFRAGVSYSPAFSQHCTFHRESLACAGLPVREDCSIVPLQHAFENGLGSLVEDDFLLGDLAVGPIEGEIPEGVLAACVKQKRTFIWLGVSDGDHPSGLVNRHHFFLAGLDLLGADRATPYDDLDGLALG